MAGLIKKQILKHLSKFAKNLSADSINLSTLRGEGELSNLELDCVAIQNLVNLPTWLQINHAKCNKVLVKIPWTKLKTTAISIFLDCVDLDMVTCEKPRPPNGPSPIEASASNGESSYGFIEKVLEGMAVRINSINVNFSSAVFKAEFQLSQLLIYSTDPEGRKADLRFTRIMNKAWGQVLTFKKITWQTMRIVTDAATAQTGGMTTPIRLITNQATIKLVLRRKVSNLAVLASRLHIEFDDLLWVLTDAQVQSAMLCVKSIRETIERSQQQGRSQNVNNSHSAQTISPPATPNVSDATPTTAGDPYFMRHIIHETSFHCDIARIDLHICDDGSNADIKASYKKVVEGGAILITLHKLKMDHYPSHKAGKGREYFRDYNEIAAARDKWAEEIINNFRKDFIELKKSATSAAQQGPKSSSKLLESCLLFRLGDIDVGQVSSSSDKERCNNKVFSSNRKELLLPDDMPLASVIVTDYFFPDGRDYPSPHSNVFIRINAPNVRAHWPSLLWINQLFLTTMNSVQRMLEDLGVAIGKVDPKDEDHTDIRIEALMPKIFIPSPEPNADINMPEGIEIQVSQATVTNCRFGENTSRESLASLLRNIKQTFMSISENSFPWDKGHDFDFIHRMFSEHAGGEDLPLKRTLRLEHPKLTGDSLKQKAYKDVWSVWIRQIWLDFHMKQCSNKSEGVNPKPKIYPFVDSVPIVMWICKNDTALPASNTKDCDQKFLPLKKPQSLPSTPCTGSEKDIGVFKSHSDCTISNSKTASDYETQSDENVDGGDSNPSCESHKKRPRNKRLLEFYRHTLEESPTPPPLPVLEGPAGTYILINSENPVRIMVDHHQFIFLLRLMDSIEKIGEKLSSDTNTILVNSALHQQDTQSSLESHPDTESSAVRLMVPSADLYIVLRPIPNGQPSVTNSTNQISATHESQTSVEPISYSTPTSSNYSVDSIRPVTPSSSECSSSETLSMFGDDPSSLSIFSPSSQIYRPDKAPLADKGQRSSLPASPTFSRQRGLTAPSVTLRKKTENRLTSRLHDVNGHLTASASCENVSSRFGTTSSSGYETGSVDSIYNSTASQEDDRQSLVSSDANSLDQFVILELDPSNNVDFSDTYRSVTKSDSMSSDKPLLAVADTSENIDHPLRNNPEQMTDSQVTVVNGDRSSSDSLTDEKEKESSTLDTSTLPADTDPSSMVSVLKIKTFNGIELGVDSHGNGSSIRLVAPEVQVEQVGNTARNDVINSFTQPARSAPASSNRSIPCARLRIDSGRCASRFYPSTEGHLELQIDSLKEQLFSSTLANLGAFLEDDVEPEVLPMKIKAANVNLTIEDDTDPVYPTTAKAPPVELNVVEAHVTRDATGVFHVESMSSSSQSASNAKAPSFQPSHENKATSTSADGLTESMINSVDDGQAQEKTTGVTDNAVTNDTASPLLHGPTLTEVRSLQAQLAEMTEERDALAMALNQLQDEMRTSEKERYELQSRLKEHLA